MARLATLARRDRDDRTLVVIRLPQAQDSDADLIDPDSMHDALPDREDTLQAQLGRRLLSH